MCHHGAHHHYQQTPLQCAWYGVCVRMCFQLMKPKRLPPSVSRIPCLTIISHNMQVVPKRTPGKSGYFGVSKKGNRYASHIVVEVRPTRNPVVFLSCRGYRCRLCCQLHPKHVADTCTEEEEIYICSSCLGLIKTDHRNSGNGRNSQQSTVQQKLGRAATETDDFTSREQRV
jgi:hypothetical protein